MENKLSREDAFQFIEGMFTMAVLDQQGRYIYVNPGWVENNRSVLEAGGKLRGLNRPLRADEILGERVWDVVPESKAAYVLEHGVPLIGEPIAPGETFTTYIPRYGPDGKQDGLYLYTIIGNLDEAAIVGKRLAERTQERDFFKQELAHERGARYNLDSLAGSSPAMMKVKQQIRMAARVPTSVLIEGETGTGKELIAHAIHAESARESANFVRINCAAIPPDLMESEFFGYASGAFTGASKGGKLGRFALADGGSIFLDEVNLLPSTMQPKFLRVLQEREITPVGSNDNIPIDVRVISACNTPMGRLVQEGKFREDLYYRLNVINIVAPPLRERKEDLPDLVTVLIGRLNRQLGMMIQGVDSRVLQLFQEYDWPGNIRELQNSLERAMSMTSSSVLTLPNFDTLAVRAKRSWAFGSAAFRRPEAQCADLRSAKDETEKHMIQDALASNGGNRTKAAKALGISRAVFYRKLEKYGIVSSSNEN